MLWVTEASFTYTNGLGRDAEIRIGEILVCVYDFQLKKCQSLTQCGLMANIKNAYFLINQIWAKYSQLSRHFKLL